MKRKKMKELTNDLQIDFWKDWLKADMLTKESMIKSTGFINTILALEDIKDKEMKELLLTMVLNSLFVDLSTTLSSTNTKRRKK